MKKIVLFLGAILLICACDKQTKEAEVVVSSVALNQNSIELIIGETSQLKATVSPSNATEKSISWASSKPSVATVSGSGLVSAIAEGSATITASCGGKSATCSVAVSKGVVAVTSVELNKTSLELTEGDSETLTASVKPNDATSKAVTWSTSDAAVATDEGGKVTAIKEGSATITAKAGDKSAECIVNVAKKVIDVTSVELNKTSLELVEGESETLIATVKPDDATDKTVMWSSSNPMIASVSNGQVVANSLGETFITASVASLSAKCKVTIRQAPPAGATDMGLSVYWASCNLEANKPEQYGGFFAWGETKSKKSFTKKNYSFDWYSSHGGWGNDMILYPNEDAAHVILGGRWRMPTRLEWNELVNSCDWIWTVINTEEGNVSGFKVVSRINGQSIFIPAAGGIFALSAFQSGDSEWTDKGRVGCYWTSSMCSKQYGSHDLSYGPYRMLFMFDEEDFDEEVHETSLYTSPENGLTIRPVCE